MSDQFDLRLYQSIPELLQTACAQYAHRPSFSNLGHTLNFGDLDRLTRRFAAYLQNETDLKPGDRIAIQLPNVLQYPVCVLGALRAGLVVVNTNPLYTEREMLHQFSDSGAKALVVLANFADRVEAIIGKTQINTLIITELADLIPMPKRLLINGVVKYIKKMVPKYHLPQAVPLNQALSIGMRRRFQAVTCKSNDTAVLQYTGGTTGVSKGAELSHQNLIANVLQIRNVWQDFNEGKEVVMTPLPLYHIFSFTVNCLAMIQSGCHSVLITNPKDIPAFISEMKKWKFTIFAGLNTLFVALYNDPKFKKIDFSQLKLTIAGGMALQQDVSETWHKVTGCQIAEGFGMTETSPVVCVNPPQQIEQGTVGLPVLETQVKVIDEDGKDLSSGERGELCVKGPQVMKGYWQRPNETAQTFTDDGWLKTGDIAIIQPNGYVKIVDRIKDMILVSGFNVYPNEVEDELTKHPGIVECAAVGVESEKSGEVVKVFVVRSDPTLTEKQVIDHAKEHLTGYKVPRSVEFRDDLPKSNVGKILRKELRPLNQPKTEKVA